MSTFTLYESKPHVKSMLFYNSGLRDSLRVEGNVTSTDHLTNVNINVEDWESSTLKV